MRNTVWGVVERLLQRGAGALVSLSLAFLTSPESLGLFATVMLALTFYQSGSDSSLRQVSPRALQSARGTELLHTYLRRAPVLGVLVVLGAVALVSGVLDGSPDRALALSLAPLALVPVVSAAGIAPVAHAQLAHEWRAITRMQLVASGTSLAVVLPLLVATGSLWACALHPLLAEGLLTLQARRRWTSSTPTTPELPFSHGDVVGTIGVNVVSWGQGQLERVVLVVVGTVSRVGEYALAVAVGRALGDAVIAGSTNVLRARMSAEALYGPEALRPTVTVHMVRLTAILLALYVALVAGLTPLVALALGPEWDAALDVVPVIALAFFPAALGWSLAAVFLHESAVSKNYPAQAVGIAMAVAIGLVLAEDLQLAAWLMVGRELVDVGVKWAVGRAYVSGRSLLVMAAGLGAGTAVQAVVMTLGG